MSWYSSGPVVSFSRAFVAVMVDEAEAREGSLAGLHRRLVLWFVEFDKVVDGVVSFGVFAFESIGAIGAEVATLGKLHPASASSSRKKSSLIRHLFP
jgi:hypothetical protein